MPLLGDLRAVYRTIDPQFLPTSQETQGFLAALALYVEHGDAFLDAAKEGHQAVTDLITADQGEDEPATPEQSDQAAAAASRRATAQQTKVTQEPASSSSKGKS